MISHLESVKAGIKSEKSRRVSDLRNVLREIAWTMQSKENTRNFGRDTALRAIDDLASIVNFTAGDWDWLVEQEIKRCRFPMLAYVVERGKTVFRFSHLTFQASPYIYHWVSLIYSY